MMVKKWIVLIFVVVFALSACKSAVYNQTEANVAHVKEHAGRAIAKSDASGNIAPSLVMKQGLYVDKTPISLVRNPSWMNSHIVIKGDQLPFSYYTRTIAMAGGNNVLTKYQTGLDSSVKVSINYSGTVRGALDVLASKTGFVYQITGNSVYWIAYVTKTYDVAFLPGSTDYMMGKKEGSSQTGAPASGSATSNFTNSDSSVDEYSNLGGKLSVWADLKDTVTQLLSPDGKVTVSQATTTITVRDHPSNVQLVSQYMANLNTKMSKQVLVKIQIIEVDLQNDYNMGINWQLIARSFHNSPFVLNGNYGTPVSITDFVGQSLLPGTVPTTQVPQPVAVPQIGTQGNGIIPSYTILLNALNQQGKASIVSEPRVVALNNQVSVIKITEQEGYVASVQNTTLAGTGGTSTTAATSTVTSQITPGNVITGITLYVLPKIMDNKIYMQVNADLSVNKGIVPFSSGGSTVQLPTIASKSFNQRSLIRSGETIILSGMRQLLNKANASQMFRSQALGGKAASQTNSETVILITPYILPGTA